MASSTVLLAADHRGYALKGKLIVWLAEKNFSYQDLGTHTDVRCDAGDFANRMAESLRQNPDHVGVLICGTGQAMAMTANRYQHLRAALCANVTVARLSREHNDANILVLGADITGEAVALDCLAAFLGTSFLGGRYAERRDKLTKQGGL